MIRFHRLLVEGETALRHLEKPGISLVPDQGLRPLLAERLLQLGQDGLAILLIPGRFLRIQADHVASISEEDLLGENRRKQGHIPFFLTTTRCTANLLPCRESPEPLPQDSPIMSSRGEIIEIRCSSTRRIEGGTFLS